LVVINPSICKSSGTLCAPGTFQNIPLTETPGNGVQTPGNPWNPLENPLFISIWGPVPDPKHDLRNRRHIGSQRSNGGVSRPSPETSDVTPWSSDGNSIESFFLKIMFTSQEMGARRRTTVSLGSHSVLPY
jgi:hypothetical protein